MRNGGVKVSSSPRREKFPEPPGLARLLYGKAVGSRSRGRTTFVSARSSPIFVSRSRSRGRSSFAGTAAAAVVVEGEPSSPKVTCIGQVRIRSKRKTPANKERSKSSSPPAPCRCLPKVLLRKIFPVREKPRSGGGGRRRSLWRRWACIRSGRSGRLDKERKTDPAEPQPQPQPKMLMLATRVLDKEDEGKDAKEKEEGEAAAAHVEGSKASPPKNALLLMRCRSTPHNRASSLATARFAVSPLAPPRDVPSAPPAEEVDQEQEEQRKPRGASEAEAVEEWDEARWSESRRPLVLPRSKSEPAARAAAKLAARAAAKLAAAEAASCFWHRRPSPALVELAH